MTQVPSDEEVGRRLAARGECDREQLIDAALEDGGGA
jgi:hypothetical protein